jgi:hypothetical protein
MWGNCINYGIGFLSLVEMTELDFSFSLVLVLEMTESYKKRRRSPV